MNIEEKQYDFKKLWKELGDIPLDIDENIEKSFLHFEIGTWLPEILEWFEEQGATLIHLMCSTIDEELIKLYIV